MSNPYDNDDQPDWDDFDPADLEGEDLDEVERQGLMDDGEIQFADPGGNSALRAATEKNPRNLPCPECREANRLTPADRAQGYRCNECADRAEGGGY